MRIDGVGSPPPLVPGASGPGAPASAANAPSLTSLVNQQLLQQEQQGGGGGGGHGGGHGVKKLALDAIDDIASRASLNIKRNERSVRARMQEIEELTDELAAEEDAQVGERQPNGERESADGDESEASDDER
jgi:hypothetical protein